MLESLESNYTSCTSLDLHLGWRAPCSLKVSETHTSCFCTASIPSKIEHLRQPEIVLQNLYYVLLDILVVSFHDRNFVLSCVRVHELLWVINFFIRSRKWVAFSSGLISDIKQKAGRWRCVFSGCKLISAAIFMINF